MSNNYSTKLLELIHGYCRIATNNMNIIDGIIAIIFEYHQIATWSKEFKGKCMELLEDDCKAMVKEIPSIAPTVRADFGIERGEIISWELECYQPVSSCYFYGVIMSKVEDFNGCPAGGQILNAYGIDDAEDTIYLGETERWTDNEGDVDQKWHKPALPSHEVFILKFTADWREKQCKLSIFYDGKKMNDTNDEYTLLLPELDDNDVWYPCASVIDEGSYVIIRYA